MLVNLLVVIIIFVLSYGSLYQLNNIENTALNKLAIVNEKQNTIEQLRAEVLQLELETTTVFFDRNDSTELKVSQRLKSLSSRIAKAKAAGGINLLELDKLTNSIEEFSRNGEKLRSIVREIKKINFEWLSPQFEKANLVVSELENSLFDRSNFSLAKTVHSIHLLLMEVKFSYVGYDKTIGIVKFNEMTNNERILAILVSKIQLATLTKQEQSLYFRLQSFITNNTDTINRLHNRVREKEIIQRRMFQLQLKKHKSIIDQLLLSSNDAVAVYSTLHKRHLAEAKVTLWTGSSVIIILLTLLGCLLRKKLIKPVSDLVEISRLLASSNFQQLLKLTKHSYLDTLLRKDQFGEIARACENSAIYQQGMIFDINTACKGITLGLLEQNGRFDYSGEYQSVECSINESKKSLRTFAIDISTVGEAIASGQLTSSINDSLYLGNFKPIAISFQAIIANQQAQLKDIVTVIKSMELGLEEKQCFVLPSNSYLGEFQRINHSLTHAVGFLSKSVQETLDQDWLKTGLSDMNRQLTGEQPLEALTKNSVDFISQYFNAPIGYIYRTFEDKKFGKAIRMIAHCGILMDDETKATRYKFVYPEGVGLIGQVFVTPDIIIRKLSEDERVPISQSGIAAAILNYVVVVPLIHEGKIEGVLELGLYEPLDYIQKEFLLHVMSTLGIAMNVAISRDKINQLLARSQQQAEELEVQQAKLAHSNDMLSLKAKELEEKQRAVQQKNQQLEQASIAMEDRARELALASKYKSEFLANMSHELRSPLNSLLMLSKLLIDNKQQNLDVTEVNYAQVIYRSGKDLLQLIEDILDLSKIEAGKTDIHYQPIEMSNLVEHVFQRFSQLAKDKQIEFNQKFSDAPTTIQADHQRLLQIMTNLLANAFKFTEVGKVELTIIKVAKGQEIQTSYGYSQQISEESLCFIISDTGIGISEENKIRVFEAFQQADGTMSRKFGGTGLGLAITLQLVELMGGFLTIDSELGVGSTFSVYLPLRPCQGETRKRPKSNKIIQKSLLTADHVSEKIIQANQHIVLIYNQDSLETAQICKLIRSKDFTLKVVTNIDSAIEIIDREQPAALITLKELTTSGQSSSVQRLKDIVAAGQLPWYLTEMTIDNQHEIDQLGRFLTGIKNTVLVDNQDNIRSYFDTSLVLIGKSVLIVDDNISNVFALSAILEGHQVNCLIADDGLEAIEIIKDNPDIDLVLMDIMMPVLDGYKAIAAIRGYPEYATTPIIALTAKAMPEDRNKCISAGANDYMTKPIDVEKLLAVMKIWLTTTPNSTKLCDII